MTAVLPIYLLVDLADNDQWPAKAGSVNEFVRGLAEDLGRDPQLGGRAQLTVVTFSDVVTAVLSRHPVAEPPVLTVLEPGGPRWFGNALQMLGKLMSQDAGDGEPADPPLVLVLADEEPGAADSWEPVRAELLRSHPGLTLGVIYPVGGRRWAADEHGVEDVLPLEAARLIVRDHVGAPGAEKKKEWEGAFTPYSVGDVGNAARTVQPRPDDTEWHRRDTVLDGVIIRDRAEQPVLELRAASVRGLSHRHYGTVRQDEYGYRTTRDGRYLVVAVADGVSNSKLSHKAAALVCRVGSDAVAKDLETTAPEDLDWPDLIAWLSGEIVALARSVPAPRTDGEEPGYREVAAVMAATALFAVIDLHPAGDALTAHVFAVGDSPAWVLRDGTQWEPLLEVKNSGEGVATSTTRALPLRSRTAGMATRATVRPGDVLVLMSDGISDPLGDGTGSVGRFLADAWREPPAPLAFAAQVDFARRTHDDDRTAVAIWVA